MEENAFGRYIKKDRPVTGGSFSECVKNFYLSESECMIFYSLQRNIFITSCANKIDKMPVFFGKWRLYLMNKKGNPFHKKQGVCDEQDQRHHLE